MSPLAGDRYAKALCAGDSSALPTAPPGAPLFSELYLSFINLIKLNTQLFFSINEHFTNIIIKSNKWMEVLLMI